MFLPHVLPCFLLGVLFAAIPPRPPAGQPPQQAAPASKRPRFLVGDTVFVAASVLNIRRQPRAEGPTDPGLYVIRNVQGTVVALPNRNWALVVFTSEDVSVEGYVSQWYLAKEKTKSGN